MDSENSRPLRRSTRQSSGKVFSLEPTPRGPLKRTRKGGRNKAPAGTVNGTKDVETGSEDEESPPKKSRLAAGGGEGDRGSENEMQVQDSDEDQEMDVGQDSASATPLPKIYHGSLGDASLSPRVVLGERCRTSHTVHEDPDQMKPKKVQPSSKAPAAPSRSATQNRSAPNMRDVPITSIAEYHRTMKLKAESADKPKVNHLIPSVYPASVESCTVRQRINNIPTQKEAVRHKKPGITSSERKNRTAVTKRSSGNSSRGFKGCLWSVVLLVLLSSATLLAYKFLPVLRRTAGGGGLPSRAVEPERFADYLSLLETQFPSQRLELWKRSKIHLEKHLKTAEPTEPVSLIFTAGRRAETTLRCLAQGVASSFSSALNVSVLRINGTSKAGQDSDEVKLDIDNQLRAAFEGEKPVAVIHRFEELPPGSTLIFYRYCDHENAAYKRVFLLFTVLLPQNEVGAEQSLKEVEEIVHDYVKERLVGSNSETAFNKMDTDKYGGLWSRISHLILPVVSEEEVELKGC
ncbi:torsin-1A-interacting protein 2-like isoform X1 [Embiotoca jacksoni]|uniref:torsin-1A-interacting protein 2-like isoform X1 n=1 Tax=Embiotoca jacksoni TaxID=100190 RepID=UPI0037037C95